MPRHAERESPCLPPFFSIFTPPSLNRTLKKKAFLHSSSVELAHVHDADEKKEMSNRT